MHIFTTVPSYKLLCQSVFVYPTETCYGLGCNATNARHVERIYRIKGRSFAKSVSWIVADFKMAERYVEFSKKARELAEKFWPGPLTLVLPLRKARLPLAEIVRSELVGLRVSSHKIAREISHRLNRPIIATSANVSGKGECYSISDVQKQLASSGDGILYIDGGILPRVPPTTVIKVLQDDIEIIREGVLQNVRELSLRGVPQCGTTKQSLA